MKNYFKLLALFILLVCFSKSANAQSARKFSVGLNVGQGLPRRDYGLAIGADFRYQLNINKWLSIPLTAGYTSIKRKDGVYSGVKFNRGSREYYPVKLGIKTNFNKTGLGLYGLLEAGISAPIISYKGGPAIAWVTSPAVGYSWKNGIDLGIKFEEYTFDGYLGIRAAYAF